MHRSGNGECLCVLKIRGERGKKVAWSSVRCFSIKEVEDTLRRFCPNDKVLVFKAYVPNLGTHRCRTRRGVLPCSLSKSLEQRDLDMKVGCRTSIRCRSSVRMPSASRRPAPALSR